MQRLTLNNFRLQNFKGRSKRDGLFLLSSIRQKGPVDNGFAPTETECRLAEVRSRSMSGNCMTRISRQKRRGILDFEVEKYIKSSQEKK